MIGCRHRALVLAMGLVAVVPGCCLTDLMWDETRPQVTGVAGAALSEEGTFVLQLETTGGDRWVSGPPGFPNTWSVGGGMVDTSPPCASLPQLIGLHENLSLDPMCAVYASWLDRPHGLSVCVGPVAGARRGHYGTSVDLPTGEANKQHATLAFEMPADWGSPWTYGACLLTPITCVIDIVCLPIEVLYIAGTVGGHGPNWIPWCEGVVHGGY
jgi:hypothetical protein